MRAWWLLLVVCLAACSPTPSFKGTDISRASWGGDFNLVSHTGAPASLALARGKVTALFFGYTHCPDICTPTLLKLAQAQATLGTDKFAIFFVTVDPKHDTPAQLQQFLQRFKADIVGVTGSADGVRAVAAAYKAAVQPGKGGTIDHAGGVYLIDRQGKPRVYIAQPALDDALVHDARVLLDH